MISCVYCGGSHARPAEVRKCWADGQPTLALDQTDVEVVAPVVPDAPMAAARAVAGTVAVGRGPHELGRHVVVARGQAEPPAWSGCRRIVIDAHVVDQPAAVVADLRSAGSKPEGVVIELVADLGPADEVERRSQWELGPGHTMYLDELRHLVWSNSVDARADVPTWAPVTRALELGASPPGEHQPGDAVLTDGRPVWIDGGPIRHLDPIHGVVVLHALQIEHGRLDPPLPNTTDAELAPDQRAAVAHAGGSARIIAPAGSGKTRVLTERARHLLKVWRLPSSAVSLVAFNKRAQEEMGERTSDLPGLNVRTLNSIALAIVNDTAPFAPQRRRWRTIDEAEVRSILQRFVQTPRKLNVDPLAPWIDALSSVRLGLLDPLTVERRYGGDVDGLTEVWPLFRDALDRDGVVDFDDQIRRAIDVLLTQPDARRAAQRACAVLLVDEFQDLTPAHMLLIRLLSGCGGVVFGVGDDDQTIYGYNGADPSWLIDFATWFPGAGDHPLEVNYRCPAGVVDVADRLLRHNRRRVPKIIRAAAPVLPDPGWSVVDGEDPVGSTVAAVTSAIASGAAPGEIAMLTRVNASIAPVQIALAASGVPIAGGVGAEFADRVAVRAGLAWIRLATGSMLRPEDLGEASRRPSRGFSSRLRGWVAEQGSVDKLLRLADRLNEPKDAQRVTDLAGDIARLQALVASGADTPRLLSVLIDEIGLGGAVASLDRNRFGMNRAAQGDDLLALRHLARLQPAPRAFEPWLRDGLFVKRDPNGVVLATVHRVKGQEWPNVVVHLAQDDVFPHRLAEDLEEERRLFHVAITRASRHVTIVTGDDPSPFVAELSNEPPAHLPEPNRPAARPATTSTPPQRSRRDDGDHPLLDRGGVMAVVGLVLIDQGQEWTITELEPAAAVATRNAATRRFALGEKVETSGRQRGALRPRSGDVDEASVRLFDLLRSYRDRVRDGKPAYTVFDDKTLAAIASTIPADLGELAAVRGVGPAKLEQYGDDVLELSAAAQTGP